MSVAKFTLESCTDLVANGIQETLKSHILKKLKAEIDPIVEAAAEEAARNVTAHVEMYHNHMRDRVELHVQFNRRP